MSDASGFRMEVSEKEHFDNMSTCDSPGPCLQNRQCPRQFLQHFPSMSLARDISDNNVNEMQVRALNVLIELVMIAHKRSVYSLEEASKAWGAIKVFIPDKPETIKSDCEDQES